MRFGRLGCAVLAGVLIAAFTGSSASASAGVPTQNITPIKLADGNDVFVTVDEAGAGHIAWNGNENTGPTSLHYCTLPRGATACSVNSTLPSDGNSQSLERPFVVANGNTVQVLSYRFAIP